MKSDTPDYELQETHSEAPSSPASPGPRRPRGLWIAGAALAVAFGAAFYVGLVWRPRPMAMPAATAPAAALATPSLPALGGSAEAITVPPLDDTDPLVRTLVRTLSGYPEVAAWLTTHDLLRNFVNVVADIADGGTPVKELHMLHAPPAFRVLADDGNAAVVDPRSYDRYTTFADAVASVDAAGAARLYATLKPRIEEAYRGFAAPDEDFDQTLTRAIVVLLRTPVIIGSVRVRPKAKGIGYAYADSGLEELPAAQKQLLRMGPKNAGLIEDKLREIAKALGIPPEALPVDGRVVGMRGAP